LDQKIAIFIKEDIPEHEKPPLFKGRAMFSPSSSKVSVTRMKRRICRLEKLEKRELLTANPKVTAVNLASSEWSGDFVDFIESQGLGEEGYAIPAGTNQTKTLPWTGLNKVKITFDQDVHVVSGDLSVSGTNVTAYAFSDFSYDSSTHTATWTLVTPLGKDKILLALDANGMYPVHNSESQALDGAWTNGVSSFPSGNGTGGDDFKFQINVLPGDVDKNNCVNIVDLYLLLGKAGKNIGDTGYSYRYDIDGNGSINATDYDLASVRFGNLLPSGNPAGMTNNAPTALPLGNVSVDANAADLVFSLSNIFADVENSDLTVSVIGNTNLSLFNSVSINNGTLTISFASDTEGTASLTLRAADSSGLFVDMAFNVTVADTLIWIPFDNPPTITDFTVIPGPGDTYTLSGMVTDLDQEVVGMVVTFGGVFESYGITAIVQADGTFETTKICVGLYTGTGTAWTYDSLGMMSNEAIFYVTV
jgi:hypothetical protein